MISRNPKTIITNIPYVPSDEVKKNAENGRVGYWLEKLYKQGERVLKDNNRREEQARADGGGQDAHDQPVSKKDQELAQSGINEHTKNIATKKEDDTKIVSDLVIKSNRSIMSLSSKFPWDLFPNTIDVEESRVTFRFRQFLSSQSHSVDIKDISNVFLESSMLFSTLQVVSRTFIQNDIKIGNLDNTKAKKIQRIIEGLRTFTENNINTSNYEVDELIAKIEEFHNDHASS